jgi:RNA polymerase sigma-70 factor (ECF subfamily)
MTNAAPPGLEALSDEDLVARVRAGESHLYELVMRRYNRRLYRAIRAIVRNESDSEELMQHAYVLAFEHLSQFEGRASFATWITRIAVHAAYAHVRRRTREPATGVDPDRLSSSLPSREEPPAMSAPPLRRDPESAASDHELRAALEASIDALPESFREVFVLRALEEMSVTETAESLGIPEQTVKTRFFRARGLLRRALMARADQVARGAFEFHLSRCDRVVAGVFRRLGLRRDGPSDP